MTFDQAIIYCLGFFNKEPEDGDLQSQIVYDRNDEGHWIAIDDNTGKVRLCSGSTSPFNPNLEPYRM